MSTIINKFLHTLRTRYHAFERTVVTNKKKLNRYIGFFTKLPIDSKKVMISNYFGHGYGDNPKCIAEELLKQGKKYRIFWLTNGQPANLPSGITPVNKSSLRAYFVSATAKVWISNIRTGRLTPKRKKQIYLHVCHGFMAVKKVEAESEDKLSISYLTQAKEDGACTDGILVENAWREQLMKKSYWLNENCEFLKIGSPKVDEFLEMLNPETITHIRQSLGITPDSYSVLYAPTFRNEISQTGYITDLLSVKNAIENRYGKVRMMIRLHPNMIPYKNKLFSSFPEGMLDVTEYPDVQEILAAADCIISDYSSMPFIFSLSGKPVFIFASDYNSYNESRGINELFKLQPFPVSYTVEQLLQSIADYDHDEWKAKRKEFFDRFPNYNDGNAAINAVKWLRKKGLS